MTPPHLIFIVNAIIIDKSSKIPNQLPVPKKSSVKTSAISLNL